MKATERGCESRPKRYRGCNIQISCRSTIYRRSKGKPFLAFELVDGGNLAECLRLGRPLIKSAAALVETLAMAMQYAHQQGIVHRDLKPANVLLGQLSDAVTISSEIGENAWPTTIKIADFGLAKLLDGAIDPTLSGDVIGTPAYMAPEQASASRGSIGVSCDVYALGAILYEMLTGQPPFCGESPWATVLQVIHEDPIPPRRLRPELPRELESICLKCLEKDPRRRYPTAIALAEDLKRFRRGESVTARPPTGMDRVRRWVVRHPVATSLATISLLAIATIVTTLTVTNIRIGRLLDSERQAHTELSADAQSRTARAVSRSSRPRVPHVVDQPGRASRAFARSLPTTSSSVGVALRQLIAPVGALHIARSHSCCDLRRL